MNKISTTLTTKLNLDNSEIELSNTDGTYTVAICNKHLMEHTSITLTRDEMQQVRNLLNKGAA